MTSRASASPKLTLGCQFNIFLSPEFDEDKSLKYSYGTLGLRV
jgi:hypothetical protein